MSSVDCPPRLARCAKHTASDMPIPDHYATFGVLPSAEGIVIRAAYRALAQRYHPDKWTGDPSEAHCRMSELNEAYRVLSDGTLRAEYDAALEADGRADFRSEECQDHSEDFDIALQQLEGRWAIAVEIYPDLIATRKALTRISTSLAFGFVTTLLESRQFMHRDEIAKTLERSYLRRYFGASPKVVAYAKELITGGHREAALTLNRFVEVMGSEVDADLLIGRIEKQFVIRSERLKRADLVGLAEEVRRNGYFDEAVRLARLLGYEVNERHSGLIRFSVEITVKSPQDSNWRFESVQDFVRWVQTNLCG